MGFLLKTLFLSCLTWFFILRCDIERIIEPDVMEGFSALTKYPDALISGLRRLVGGERILVIYALVLAFLLSPLWPLDIILLVSLSVYMYYRFRRDSLLLVGVSIVYAVSSFTGYYVIGLILLAGFVVIVLASEKKFLLSLGVVFSALLTYQVLKLSHMVTDYLLVFKRFLVENGYEAVGIHIVVLLTVFIYVSMSTSFFRDTRIGRYFTENPGAYPVIQFMVLLVYAAVLLAYGNEALANKYAELAYYSLVVGVALSIPQALTENPEEEEEQASM